MYGGKSKSQLVALARERGLSTSGSAQALIARLVAADTAAQAMTSLTSNSNQTAVANRPDPAVDNPPPMPDTGWPSQKPDGSDHPADGTVRVVGRECVVVYPVADADEPHIRGWAGHVKLLQTTLELAANAGIDARLPRRVAFVRRSSGWVAVYSALVRKQRG